MTRREWLALAVVMAVAAGLRLGWPGISEFKLDEARVYSLALELVELRSLPLAATDMSVGLPNSPLAIYLYALPMFIWKSPLAPLLFGAALNTAAVGLLYWVTRRYWGGRAALFAALLYACAPWAVLYSRKIWASNLLPLFLVGYVATGLLAFAEGRRRWVFGHLVLLSVVVQLHISSLTLAPVTGAMLLLNRRRLDWRWVGAGVAAALLLEAPFLGYLATTTRDVGGGAALVAGRAVQLSLDVVGLAALVVEGTYTHSLAGPAAYQAFQATLPNFYPLYLIEGLLVLGGAGVLALDWRRDRRLGEKNASAQAGGLILLWLLLPLLIFLVHVSPVYPHYLTIYFSAGFVLAGVAVDRLWARVRTGWPRGAVAALPVVIAAAQVWQVGALLSFVGSRATPGAFGVPLRELLHVADLARQQNAPDLVVVSDGVDRWNDGTPAVFDVLLHGVPHRFIDGRTTAVFPEGPAAAILWPVADGYGWPIEALYQAWGGGQWKASVPLRAGEGTAVMVDSAGGQPTMPEPREASALLANGTELLGTGRDDGGWQLWWRALGPRPGEDYHVFAHLLDAADRRVAQADTATYPGGEWRAGDLVVSQFALPVGVVVRAGMYAYPSLIPVAVLDAAGDPAGDYLLFPR